MIKLIFASGENGEFGTPTGMPWPRHKQDMQEFKRLTKNNLVVMGNETLRLWVVSLYQNVKTLS